MANTNELFPAEDTFGQTLSPEAQSTPATTVGASSGAKPLFGQKTEPAWTLLTESEEYLDMLQKRHDALKAGKVVPRSGPLSKRKSPTEVDGSELIDWDNLEVAPKKYPDTEDLLSEIRDDLEYDVLHLDTLGRTPAKQADPEAQSASDSESKSESESSSSEDEELQADAFEFGLYEDEESEEDLF